MLLILLDTNAAYTLVLKYGGKLHCLQRGTFAKELDLLNVLYDTIQIWVYYKQERIIIPSSFYPNST